MNRGFRKISKEQYDKDFKDIQNELYPEDYLYYEEIKLPKRGTALSAGYDIFSTQSFTLDIGEEIKIPTGLKVFLNKDEFLGIYPRSGLGFKYYTRLANTVGVIDADYINSENEGHIWVKIRNEGEKELTIYKREAICQAIFQKYLLVDGDKFEGEERTGGFGSTDK